MAENLATYLSTIIQEHYPEADTRPGTVTRDWIIAPLSVMLETYDEQVETIRNSQSMSRYDQLSQEAMDGLAANLYVTRDPGARARTAVVLGFDEPRDIALQAGDLVQNSNGTKQYALVDGYAATSQSLTGRQRDDGLFYTETIAVEATRPGANQEVAAGELVDMPFGPSGLTRVSNELPSRWGAAAESNAELYDRLRSALSTRQVLNAPGTRYILQTHFRQLQEIFLVGSGHPLMQRDETFARASQAGSILPVATLQGKTQGDSGHRARALRLATTLAVPALGDFRREVTTADYQAMASYEDAIVATFDTSTLFADSFGARASYVPAETTLASAADGSATVVVANAQGIAPGDRLTIREGNLSVDRTVHTVQATVLTLTEDVNDFTDAAVVTKQAREQAVGNGWIESTHASPLGTEADGPAATLHDGRLVLGRASYATRSQLRAVTDTALTTQLRATLKQSLQAHGYNPSDARAVGAAVDALALQATTTTAAAATAGDTTLAVVSTAAFASSGTIFIENTEVTYTGTTATSFTGCTGTPAATSGTAVAAGVLPAVKNHRRLSVSPVVQRTLAQHNGLRITGQWSTTDATTDGRFFWLLTRRKSTGNANYYYGFGVALRRSVADATATTLAAAASEGDTTLTVVSTSGFDESGAVLLTVGSATHYVPYTGKTDTTFTGCTGTPAATVGAAVQAPKNSVFIVDNGDLPTNENSFLAAAKPFIRAGTNYRFELLLSPPSPSAVTDESVACEFRLWEDDPQVVRPATPTLSYGSYIPSSVRGGYSDDTDFGFSAYDNDGGEWTVDDLQVESIAAVYPHYLFRLDATPFNGSCRVRVHGRAWGQADDDTLARGMTVRLWNATTSAWVEVGASRQTATAAVLSEHSYAVSTYRDANRYLWVMVSGDHPWGVAHAAGLEVGYVSVFDDGIEGLHIGGKVDVYVRAYDPIRSSTVDVSAVPALVPLSAAQGFDGPVARIDAIYALPVSGQPAGQPYTEGVDYVITDPVPHLRYSGYEQPALSFAPTVQGGDIRIFYSHYQHILDIQRFLEQDDQRMVACDTLVRGFIPAFVSFTVRMSGHAITDEAMQRALVRYVNARSRRLEVSDIVGEGYRLGATRIETPLLFTVEEHTLGGDPTTTVVSDDIALGENVRFVAQTIQVIRI